jgi:hypothetical protein
VKTKPAIGTYAHCGPKTACGKENIILRHVPSQPTTAPEHGFSLPAACFTDLAMARARTLEAPSSSWAGRAPFYSTAPRPAARDDAALPPRRVARERLVRRVGRGRRPRIASRWPAPVKSSSAESLSAIVDGR